MIYYDNNYTFVHSLLLSTQTHKTKYSHIQLTYIETKNTVRPLNAVRTSAELAWIAKRDALWQKWQDAACVDLSETWARAATREHKVIMCLEAHQELGWSVTEFDTQGQRACTKHKNALKRSERTEKRKERKERKVGLALALK